MNFRKVIRYFCNLFIKFLIFCIIFFAKELCHVPSIKRVGRRSMLGSCMYTNELIDARIFLLRNKISTNSVVKCLRQVALKYVFVILYQDMRILRRNMYLENMVIMICTLGKEEFRRGLQRADDYNDGDHDNNLQHFFSEDVLLILAGIREFDYYPRLKCVMSTIFCSVFVYNLSNVYDPSRIIFKGDATNTTNQYEIFKESY